MIDTIYRLGDDALSSHAIITFDPLPFLTHTEAMQFRISDFTIPEFRVGSYTVQYKNQKFPKPSGTVETSNSFDFQFRGDKYYQIYQELMVWKQLLANDETGAGAEDVNPLTGQSELRTDFTVTPVDSNGIVTGPGWSFKGAYLKSLGSISYTQTSTGNPLSVRVSLEYVKCIPN